MLVCAALSTICYRRMGHGMGQWILAEILPNFWWQNIKEKFQNHGRFGTFMVRMAIQNFLKNPVISTVLEDNEQRLSCIWQQMRGAFVRNKRPFSCVRFCVAFWAGKGLLFPLCTAITMPPVCFHGCFHGSGGEIRWKGKNPQNGHIAFPPGVHLNRIFQSWFCQSWEIPPN